MPINPIILIVLTSNFRAKTFKQKMCFRAISILIQMNFPVGNCPGGSFPGWEFSGWELSGWELSWLEIFLGRRR